MEPQPLGPQLLPIPGLQLAIMSRLAFKLRRELARQLELMVIVGLPLRRLASFAEFDFGFIQVALESNLLPNQQPTLASILQFAHSQQVPLSSESPTQLTRCWWWVQHFLHQLEQQAKPPMQVAIQLTLHRQWLEQHLQLAVLAPYFQVETPFLFVALLSYFELMRLQFTLEPLGLFGQRLIGQQQQLDRRHLAQIKFTLKLARFLQVYSIVAPQP